VLIGTKYDQFAAFPKDEQEEITKQAKRFSKAMHAPLVSTLLEGMDGAYLDVIPDLLLDITFYQCSEDF
jgi:hypothetical protein